MSKSLHLIIGDKNLSSWSMRPWLVLKASGLPFEEIKILLDTPQTKRQIAKYSPSGRVPVLVHGKTRVWESLAICEYVAELAPDSHLWPEAASDRAVARSLTSEMHSGFASLRNQLSMDIQLRMKLKHLTAGTIADIERVLHIWNQSIRHNGGPFLLGKRFGIADAFFAPVVLRFQSYGIDIESVVCQKYMKAVLNYGPVQEWVAEARKEKSVRLRFG